MKKYALQQTPIAIAIGAVLSSGSACAATITVTSALDSPIGSLPDVCTLRSAVTAANLGVAVDDCSAGSAGGNEIVFDGSLVGSTITLGFGELEVEGELSVRGPVSGDHSGIVLDGNQASRIISAYGDAPGEFTLELDSLSLINGRTTANQARGGAVRIERVNLVVRDSMFEGNSTLGLGSLGGGVWVYYGDLSMINSVVTGNSTTGEFGVGGGVMHVAGDLLLTDSMITDNMTTGKDGRGAGLYMGLGDAQIINTVVTGNSTMGESAFYGGVHLRLGEFLIQDSIISNNTTIGDGAFGAGLSVFQATALVLRSTISGNTTSGQIDDAGSQRAASGGGLIVDESVITVMESTIDGNSTSGELAHGAGVYVGQPYGDGTSELVVINSTISGNHATGSGARGGGIYLSAEAAATLTHATVVFNTATSGGDGVHKYNDEQAYYASLGLRNSIVAQALGSELACNQAPASVSNSLDTDGSCVSTGTPLAAIDLQPLADNGGQTRTHALGPGSVAINSAGDCYAQFVISRDQRGESRPGPGSVHCDTGAFEYQAPDQVFRDRFENP